MSDVTEDICDALVASLQEAPVGTFDVELVVEKPGDPNAELDKASDVLRILFWPHSETEKKIGRGGPAAKTYGVAMLAIRKLSVDFDRVKMHGIVTQLMDYLRGRRMAGRVYSGAETTKADNEQIHDHQRVAVATILTYVGTA